MRPSASAIEPLGHALGQNDDLVCFRSASQAVDQLLPGAARQAVHAQRRMARIVEIVDHVERQAVTVRQPFDQRPRPCATASTTAGSASLCALR